ncbi:hypothetical protein CFC21_051654, partial [Triticum aestivum]
LLQHQQALGAVRRRGRRPGRRQPLQNLHQPAGQGVAHQAVRAPPRRRRHGRRPRVRAPPLRRRQRHRRAAALHQEPLRPGLPLLQRRVRGQPVPRLHRRAGAALHQHPPLRRRGAVPAHGHQGLVAGQVHAALPPALQLRRHRRGQRPGGALLLAHRHRLHLPPAHGHRRHAVPGRRDRGRLQAPAPARLPARPRGGVPRRGRQPRQAAAPHHLPQVVPAVPERARHGARAAAAQFDVRIAEPDNHTDMPNFARLVNSADVMMGVHGAGLTNMVFLPSRAVLLQVVPFGGLEWLSRVTFKDPAKDFDGWNAIKTTYLDKQSVRLDLAKLTRTLQHARSLLP